MLRLLAAACGLLLAGGGGGGGAPFGLGPPAVAAAAAAAAAATATTTAIGSSPNATRALPSRLRGLQSRDPCFALPVDWSSERGQLLVNGFPFHLKGVSWFGFETNTFFPHGLWGATTMDRVFTFMRDNGFNALRVPFSAELALDVGRVVRVEDPALDNLGNLERLARFVDVAARYNILIMMDMHRLEANGGITELWYDNGYPYSRVLQAWSNVIAALQYKWNFFAVDLKNEPHGAATWGANNRATDWNAAATDMAVQLTQRFPDWRGLVFVEGVTNPTVYSRGRDPNPTWWGGSLEGVWDFPIETGDPRIDRRIVYSPHVYGPDVYDQWYFRAGDFPRNLPSIWYNHFGFAEKVHGRRAVVLGEYGGFYGRGPSGNRDGVFQDALVDWLVANCLEDTFYWGINPNSGDTGGVLEDNWVTPVRPKLNLLARLQPQPSLLYTNGGGGATVCLVEGAYANPRCQG